MRRPQIFSAEMKDIDDFKKNCAELGKKYSDVINDLIRDWNEQFKKKGVGDLPFQNMTNTNP